MLFAEPVATVEELEERVLRAKAALQAATTAQTEERRCKGKTAAGRNGKSVTNAAREVNAAIHAVLSAQAAQAQQPKAPGAYVTVGGRECQRRDFSALSSSDDAGDAAASSYSEGSLSQSSSLGINEADADDESPLPKVNFVACHCGALSMW